MTDVYSPEKRSAVMRRVKSSATAPELAVRRLVWSLGGRYRLNRADLPGKPDIVLADRRLAILVHGCFWHGHDCARGARVPKANRDYWVGKVARNRERDVAARAALEEMGWRAEAVWECDLRNPEGLRQRLAYLLANPEHPKGMYGDHAHPPNVLTCPNRSNMRASSRSRTSR